MDKEYRVHLYNRIVLGLKRRKFCYLQQHGWASTELRQVTKIRQRQTSYNFTYRKKKMNKTKRKPTDADNIMVVTSEEGSCGMGKISEGE